MLLFTEILLKHLSVYCHFLFWHISLNLQKVLLFYFQDPHFTFIRIYVEVEVKIAIHEQFLYLLTLLSQQPMLELLFILHFLDSP